MALYARIVDGVVAELFAPADGVTLADSLHPELAAQCVAVPPGASPQPGHGCFYANGSFTPPPPPPPLSLEQLAMALLAGGIAIASTATPALNGSYPVDAETRSDIQGELLSLVINNTFTNGEMTIAWPDVTGAPHSFTVAQFKAFATAIGGAVGPLKIIIASGAGTLPVQPAPIA
jgi:hypothetical protein